MWDYKGRKVHLSMPTYVQKALRRFQNPPLQIRRDQPHPNSKKTYGAKELFVKPINEIPLLDKVEKKFIQEVTGVFLFLAQAMDGIMFTPLIALTSK
jgi:hypothetical protein